MSDVSIPQRRRPRFKERDAGVRLRRPRASAPAQPTRPDRPGPVARVARSTWWVPTTEQMVYAVFIAFALLVRVWALGGRAMHGDEAVHAWLSWNLFRGAGYAYDPVYHGPLQFILTSVLFFLFGVSDTSARLLAVLFGTGLVALPYLLRPYMGRVPALCTSLLIALSPAFAYVSRLERDDALTAFFALLLAITLFRFVTTGSIKSLYVAAAAAALSLSAMENTYITLFIFASFWFVWCLAEVVSAGSTGGRAQRMWAVTGGEGALSYRSQIVVAATLFVGFVVTVITGSHVLFPLLLAVGITLLVHRQVSFFVDRTGERPLSRAIAGVSGRQWLNLLTVVAAILALAYSTFGIDQRGIWDATQPLLNHGQACAGNSFILNPCRKDIIGGLFYWLSQHQVHRGGQPWFYYSLLAGLYEQMAVAFGLLGIIMFARRPSLFSSFVIFWAVLSFGIYSWAGEKFSWLLIHPLIPLTVLASMALVELLKRESRIRVVVGVVASLLLLVQLHNFYEVNFVHGDDPVEMMVYVQSSPDTPKVAQQIQTVSYKASSDLTMPVTIDTLDTWPFAWYLRDMPHVAYAQPSTLTSKPFVSNPVILVDQADQAVMAPKLRRYSAHEYMLRWWFPEDYKTWTWARAGELALRPASWSNVVQWFVARRPFGRKDGVHFYYYVKRGFVSPY